MKYPIKIIEYGQHAKSCSQLIKTIGRSLPEVDPVDPPEEVNRPQFYDPPSFSYSQPKHEPVAIGCMEIPPEYIGHNDNYAIEIDGDIINGDHAIAMRYRDFSYDYDTNTDTGITLYPWFKEINCGSNGEVCLRDLLNSGERIGTTDLITAHYKHQATVRKVTFTPMVGQKTDYIADGGARIMELNPKGEFEFLGDGKFSIVLRSVSMATKVDWRDDNTIVEDHYNVPGRRIKTTRLVTTNGKLEYTLSMLGETFNTDANLVGNEYTTLDYTISFIKVDSNQIEITLNYDGEITPEIQNRAVYIRLTPKCKEPFWVTPPHFTRTGDYGDIVTDYQLADRTELFEDGQIIIKLDCVNQDSTGLDGSASWEYSSYNAEINFTEESISTLINTRLQEVIERANNNWNDWYSKHTHIPEYTYNPTNVSYLRVDTWDSSVYYANHTKYSRRSPDGENWTWYELIGDGSVYYKMVSEAMLVSEGQPSTDFVIAEPRQTLTNWMSNNLVGYTNGIISQNIPWYPSVSLSTVPSTIDFTTLSSYIHDSEPRDINANFGIKAYAQVAVAKGTVTTPAIGLSWSTIHGNIVVTKTGDAPNPNV